MTVPFIIKYKQKNPLHIFSSYMKLSQQITIQKGNLYHYLNCLNHLNGPAPRLVLFVLNQDFQ